MNRGYLDFQRLYRLHQAGAFFVTRAKSSLHARRVYSDATNRATGVIADQRVMLEGYYSVKDYPEHIRRIRFKDPATDKTLIFLTNNTALPATTIADLYKSRWQVELFFKWIKQNLRIKHFFGTSENAVKTQIWCAVCTYVLIAIIKKELQINALLYTCLQILSVSIFEKPELSCALQPPEPTTIITTDANQLILNRTLVSSYANSRYVTNNLVSKSGAENKNRREQLELVICVIALREDHYFFWSFLSSDLNQPDTASDADL